jgi:hypothetical protein
MSQIVFLSLFLGLVSGPQLVELRVSGDIRSVRFEMEGDAIGTLQGPEWRGVIDFGIGLDPRELIAIGLDEKGNELTRATQVLNLPRPVAEVSVLLAEHEGGRRDVAIEWVHRANDVPAKATLTIDGKKVELDKRLRATLPPFDMSRVHVLSAEVRFTDGFVARQERVLGGSAGYIDSSTSELTPIVVQSTDAKLRPKLDDCFVADRQPVRTSAVDRGRALVIFVKHPRDEATQMFAREEAGLQSWSSLRALRRKATLDADTDIRLLWPITNAYPQKGAPNILLFPPSENLDMKRGGIPWLLKQTYDGPADSDVLRFTDAVAAAGVTAMREGKRRAVVLVLSETPDRSAYDAAEVRRYLAALGVPLFVWSPTGTPDPATAWGSVEDISRTEGLVAAAAKVRDALASQQVVWLAASPITALHVSARPGCGVTPVAR